MELGVHNQALSRQETVKQDKRCVVGVCCWAPLLTTGGVCDRFDTGLDDGALAELRAASTRPLLRSGYTFRSFTMPRSLFDCLVRSSAARSATRSCHARAPRSRLVAAAALRERLSRRQRAVYRLAQLLLKRFIEPARRQTSGPYSGSRASGRSCRPSGRSAGATPSSYIFRAARAPAPFRRAAPQLTVFRRTASKPATPTPSSPAAVATTAGRHARSQERCRR